MTLSRSARVELHVGDDRRGCRRLAELLGKLGGLLLGQLGGLAGRAAQTGKPGLGRLSLLVHGREDIGEDVKLVGAVPFLGVLAVDHRVAEPAHVARGFPDPRIHDDRAIEPDHVVAHLDVVAPPGLLDIPLQLDAQRTVVPEAVDSAIDLARGEDEPSALAQRDQLVHFQVHHQSHLPIPHLINESEADRGTRLPGFLPSREVRRRWYPGQRQATMRRGSRRSSATIW